ncbi:MAG TPA: amidohydrolase family protein [Flavobacteriales bacterium]|nr:amidohydrolase family protein [Flavobacteriales bacterium]
MRIHSLLLAAWAFLFADFTASAQENAPVNGPHDRAELPIALVHATVHVSPTETLTDATVLIQGERILEVGKRVRVPAGAEVHDLSGLHVWPGLIDPFSDLGIAARDRGKAKEVKGAHYWDRAIVASTNADELYVPDEKRASVLRAQGFTTVVAQRRDGIARGTGCAITLADRTPAEDIFLPRATANFSFNKGSSPDVYPGSLMGSIALLRQALYDTRWYAAGGEKKQSDADLEALNTQLQLPLVFEADGHANMLRAAKLGKEFGLNFILKGGGDAYLRLADILGTGSPLIIPLVLPEAYDVEDPFDALEVTLGELKDWELAPSNAGRIAEAGGVFAFTAQGLREPAEMWPALRQMVRAGLDTATALAALTTVPARLFQLSDQVGTLGPGVHADLIISSKHLLDPENVIHETWADGRRFILKPLENEDPRGTFDLNLRSVILKLRVKGTSEKPIAEVRSAGADTTWEKAILTIAGPVVSLWFQGEKLGFAGPVRLNGVIHDRGGIWDGQAQGPTGEWFAWSAIRQRANGRGTVKEKNALAALDSILSLPPGEVWYPMNAFGSTQLPDTETVIFRNATVWSNGPQGTLPNTDVCIRKGRIVAVGPKLSAASLFPKERLTVPEIDASGMHLTSGIIDEHSHIGIASGVNEGAQSVTSEVRVGDVIDPDDINLYRALAGGVTAVQQLHGSANAIGGQSSLIKLRWGRDADDLPIAGAPGFIKFALGENVKRSNWGSSDRFPQTRMGVEQVFYDAFHRAKDYAAERAAYDAMKPKEKAKATPPRRDLELDALAEILAGTRHVTCHSYVQSEILMLIHVADSMGFQVNTFTHVLEGYKVARELKQHGANASTFSDWWAYKFEVNDAIPYNAAILNEQGVNTCINSDDAEMGRRLNQEAAKTVKYGGVSPEGAWKMVTLNPAKALHLDERMGSVEVGKDADLVLWNDNPLGIRAKAMMTFVDGVRYYDRRRDLDQHMKAEAERSRIVAKMLAAKQAGAAVRKARRQEPDQWHCETIGEHP